VFQGYAIRNCQALRVTRDSTCRWGGPQRTDEDGEEHLRSRRRGAVVRLQYEQGSSPVPAGDAHRGAGAFAEDSPPRAFAAFSDLMQIYSQLDLPHLKDPPRPPLPVPQLDCTPASSR